MAIGNDFVAQLRHDRGMRRVVFGLFALVGVYLTAAQIAAGRPWFDVLLSVGALAVYWFFAALIVFRRDGHATGWLLALLGLLLAFDEAVAFLDRVGESWATWFGSWVWTGVFAVFAALTLTFPSGHKPQGTSLWARAGRVVLWLLPALVVAAMLTTTLGGSPSTAGQEGLIGLFPGWVNYAALLVVVLILVAGTISLFVKRRRASGVERAQITWVVFGLMVLALAIVLTFVFIVGSITFGNGDPGEAAWGPAWLVMVTFPVWFGVSILRYRLFEIDRIVSRTVSYTVVVALLAALFALAVTLVGSLLPSATGDLGVAASTLLVAALFNPLRKRVQQVVDRRFNRSQYDALRIADGFSDMVRDEVDTTRILANWLDVVDRTVQPATTAVWIRGADTR